MNIEELISAFQTKFSLQGLEVKDGACALKIDEVEVDLVESLDGSGIIVTSCIGETPQERPDVFLGMLLVANTDMIAHDAMAFTQISETGAIALEWRVATVTLDLDKFCEGLEEFVNRVEQWKKILEDYRPVAAASNASEQETSAPGMMMV